MKGWIGHSRLLLFYRLSCALVKIMHPLELCRKQFLLFLRDCYELRDEYVTMQWSYSQNVTCLPRLNAVRELTCLSLCCLCIVQADLS